MLYDVLLFCRDIYRDDCIPFKFASFILLLSFLKFYYDYYCFFNIYSQGVLVTFDFFLVFPSWKIQIPYKTSSFCLADSTLPVHRSQ